MTASQSSSGNSDNPRHLATEITVEHELRLRRWAREYYVPVEQRSQAWHPVILHEMELKDYEEAYTSPVEQCRFVPLEPSIERRFDQKQELSGPHFLRRREQIYNQERLYASIVPGEMYYT